MLRDGVPVSPEEGPDLSTAPETSQDYRLCLDRRQLLGVAIFDTNRYLTLFKFGGGIGLIENIEEQKGCIFVFETDH